MFEIFCILPLNHESATLIKYINFSWKENPDEKVIRFYYVLKEHEIKGLFCQRNCKLKQKVIVTELMVFLLPNNGIHVFASCVCVCGRWRKICEKLIRFKNVINYFVMWYFCDCFYSDMWKKFILMCTI